MRTLARLTILALGVSVVWLGWEVWQIYRGRASAIHLLAQAEWAPARAQLSRYLRLFPNDFGARMLLAEAYGLDESLDGREGALQAIAQLQRVPDSAPQSAIARTKEGSLRLLLLSQPIAGERALRRAIELDFGNYEAHFMLWKVLELTGRSHLTEPVFWRAYETSPPENRLNLLREWFLSEFQPDAITAPLDRNMGFLADGEQAGVLVESKRLYRFWLTESESPIIGSAIARLYLRDGMRHEAREVFAEIQIPSGAPVDPFYLATQISIHHDFGEFSEAQVCLDAWPEPQSGFEFWKWKGILLDDMAHDDGPAVDAYDQALAVWPGNSDGRLMHRKSRCLERLGRHQEASQVRERVTAIAGQMEPELHKRLRLSLNRLHDPAEVEALGDFYQRINRHREADAWNAQHRELLGRLQAGRVDAEGEK
jgi:tetratricopeptide (TPR) repeat protein